uniref:NADH-ubiquinone oxidoreductase chain 1 n=1 Tax=Graptacme eborea TaxID=55752 RepID=Q68SQ1_GRAEB|nr:NADH dehydrogenase subunit 1 [Graptacme eborea]AAT98396.1 NADH dehydrogenase subunit 1 [Graptacme eborea]
MKLLNILVTFLMIMLSVAFFTLLERKGLGYMQNRKGPNKVSFMGWLQPISDAMKLLTKQMMIPSNANIISFLIGPCLLLTLSLMIWLLYPSSYLFHNLKMSGLLFLCISSMSIYGLLLAGWGSNSKYSMLGAIRGSAQTISYEVCMALIFIFFLFMPCSINTKDLNSYWNSSLFFGMMIMWFISCLAETNRAPFDFAEGESELVSGFNVEYGSVGFTMIFLAEYMTILFMSVLTSMLIGIIMNLYLFIFAVFISFVFIWVRASFPRTRYDFLMNLMWKNFLPLVLSFFLMSIVM